jgi:hypothetical protein
MLRKGYRLPATLLLALCLAACGEFKADLADAKKSQADIKSELGVDSQVSFRVFSGTKGKKLAVTVALKSPPTGDVGTLKARVSDIVARDFRSHVDNVSVAF